MLRIVMAHVVLLWEKVEFVGTWLVSLSNAAADIL